MRILILIICIVSTALLTSGQITQGPLYPDSIRNDNSIGSDKWTKPIYAADSDKLYTTVGDWDSSAQSNYLLATHFHFTIPSTAIIKGILVEVLGHCIYNGPPGPSPLRNSYISLIKNDTIQKAAILNALLPANNDKYWISFGGDTSMWSDTTLKPTDINNSNFGVAYYVLFKKDSIFINSIRVTVYYSNPAGVEELSQVSYSDLRVYPNPSTGIFTLQIADGHQPMANSKIEVYNMLGEKVMNETLRPVTEGQGGQTQGDNKIDLSAQPTGIYLYRVTDEYGQLIGSGKLIKE